MDKLDETMKIERFHMLINNYSKNIEEPEPIEISSVWNYSEGVRLIVPILQNDGSYKKTSFVVNAYEMMKAINELLNSWD